MYQEKFAQRQIKFDPIFKIVLTYQQLTNLNWFVSDT